MARSACSCGRSFTAPHCDRPTLERRSGSGKLDDVFGLRARAVVMLGASILACTPQGNADDDESDTTSPPPELEEPEFLEPPNDEVTIRIDRSEDLVLGVNEIVPGLTRIVLDGQEGSGVGEEGRNFILTTTELTLQLRGGLIPADHVMQLQTQAADSPTLRSSEVLIRVQRVDAPRLAASLDSNVIVEADTLDAQGHGEEGLLYTLDLQQDEALLTLFAAQDTGWDTDTPSQVELPEFVPIEDARFAVSATLHTHDDEVRTRVAWRAGSQGDRILGIDAPWPLEGIVVQRAIEVSTAVDEYGSAAIEYATLGRAVWVGDTVVAEALLATDVEHPLPGSRTLLTAQLQGEPARFGPTRLSTVGEGRDIDLLAPTTDLLAHATGGVHGLSARAAGLRPVVIDVDPTTGTLSERPTSANDRFSIIHDATAPIQTVLGALGSRQVFTPLGGPEPRVFLQHLGDHPGGGATNAAPRGTQLEMLDEPSGPAVATVLAGVPLYIVPQGVERPVVAILSVGTTPSVQPLDGLACDDIAVPRTEASAETREVSVACLREREVSIGRITALEEE